MGMYAKVVAYAFDEECKCVGYRFIPVKDDVSVNLIFTMVDKTFEGHCTAMEIVVLDNYPALTQELEQLRRTTLLRTE